MGKNTRDFLSKGARLPLRKRLRLRLTIPTPCPLPRLYFFERGGRAGAGGGDYSIHLISKGELTLPLWNPFCGRPGVSGPLRGMCERVKLHFVQLTRQEPLGSLQNSHFAVAKPRFLRLLSSFRQKLPPARLCRATVSPAGSVGSRQSATGARSPLNEGGRPPL